MGVSQMPDDPARSLVGVKDWGVPMRSHTHNDMDKATRGRSGLRSIDGPCPPARDNGVLVQTLGEYTDGFLQSQVERDFGSKKAAERAERDFFAAARRRAPVVDEREILKPQTKASTLTSVHLGLMGVGATERIGDLLGHG